MINSYERLKKQEKEKMKIPRSTQDMIHVDVIYKDGIFRIGSKFAKISIFIYQFCYCFKR